MSFKDILRTIDDSWVYLYVHKARFISGRIKEVMCEADVSSAELSRRMDVNPSSIAQYLDPEANLTVKTLTRIAHALRVDVETLFSDTKPDMNIHINTVIILDDIDDGTERIELPEELPIHQIDQTIKPQMHRGLAA